jgi:hypothetical protein
MQNIAAATTSHDRVAGGALSLDRESVSTGANKGGGRLVI